MNKNSIKGVFMATVLFLLYPLTVSAVALDYGELVGVWDTPNDTSQLVSNYLSDTDWALADGQKLTELARNENVFYSEGLLNVPLSPTIFGYNSEPTDGLWAYLGGAKVDFLTVATSSHFALYAYSNSQWIGMWTTGAISDFINSTGQGMQHITAYSISAVPLPAAAPLFATAIALFGFVRYRRKGK